MVIVNLILKEKRRLYVLEVTRKAIKESFHDVASFLKNNKVDVIKKLPNCTEEEQIAMQFLYSSMPISDIVDYNFGTYLIFAHHALFLKENVPWCEDIPDDIFLNYVLAYRINNEDIEENRKYFHELIYKELQAKQWKMQH